MSSERSIRLPAGTISYSDRGSGPPIVFIHGVFVNGAIWRDVVAPLAASHRCIVPTLPLGAHTTALEPGSDRSPAGFARLIADLLAALDLHDVTLVGNDTGGALCQLVIAEHPERIARIVLTNCDTFENFPPPILAPVYRAARLPGFFWLCGQLLRSPIAQRAFYRTVAHRVPAPDVLAAMLRPLRANAGVRADLAAFIASITSRELIDIAPRLAAFAGPALIVWGDDDWFFPMRDARRLAGAFRAATLVTVAGSRTFVSEDAPMVLAESIERFLAAAVPA